MRRFTLIEMLVVIAIIAILAGLLVGPLMKSTDSGRAAACVNLIRQYSTATMQYVPDNDGMLIDVYNYLTPNGGLPGYMNVDANVPESYTRCPGDSTTESLGRLFTHTTTTDQFYEFVTSKPKISIGANENTLSASRRPTSVGPSAFWNKLSKVQNPSRSAVWCDFQNPTSSSLTAPVVKPGGGTSGPSMNSLVFRHNSGFDSNIGYADGHVGLMSITLETANNGHDLASTVTSWGDMSYTSSTGTTTTVTNATVGRLFKGFEPFFGPSAAPFTASVGNWAGITFR